MTRKDKTIKQYLKNCKTILYFMNSRIYFIYIRHMAKHISLDIPHYYVLSEGEVYGHVTLPYIFDKAP